MRSLARSRGDEIDWTFLFAALALAGIGVAALASATGPQAALAVRQGGWIALGLVGLTIALAFDYERWLGMAPLIYGVNLLGLAAVLLVGHRVNGSKSWITHGSWNLQPSEFMKIGTVLLIARLLATEREDQANLRRVGAVAAAVGAPTLLILMQPDMGTALTFMALLAVSLFVVGLARKTWLILGLLALSAGVVGWTHVMKDYQKERVRTFLYPENDPLKVGYQIIQSRIAIGSGGLLGKGYASGTQSQLNFIPEKHTDFIYPVVAEEWGFLGSLAVLGLYGVLASRGLQIAARARDAFGAYVVLGMMTLVATHVIVNLGMVTGLMPTIGIPLPLMSYGGSSVVSTLIGMGLVLNVGMRRRVGG